MTWIRIFRHVFGVQSLCRKISLKMCLIFCFVLSLQFFEQFSSHSTTVSCFSSFEAVDGILNLACREFWDWLELSRHLFFCFSVRDSAFFPFFVIFAFVVFIQFCVELSAHTCAIPFLDVMVSPFMFLTFGMRIRFFADLTFEMFFVPLSSSKIFWIFLALQFFFSLMHFFAVFAHFTNAFSLVLHDGPAFLYEGQNLFVFVFCFFCF